MIDTVTLVSIVLSAVGAGGGLLPAARKVRALARERRRRRDTRETPQEFYYRSCTMALRVVVPDQRYIHRREGLLVSRRDGLSRVPWGFRPCGEVEIVDERVSSRDPAMQLSLVDGEETLDQGDGWKRRYIQFGQPLRRHQEVGFVDVQHVVVVGKPLERFLRWSPVTRCDRITLQVAFASDPPATVRYFAYGPTGEQLESYPVELDVITGAFTVQIDKPIPGRYYKLRW